MPTIEAARKAKLRVGEGDLVQIKPRHRNDTHVLAGRTATVTKVNRETVVIDCPDEPEYGTLAGRRVRVQARLVRKPSRTGRPLPRRSGRTVAWYGSTRSEVA